MKRIIKDYKSLSDEHIELINKHYPNGFENDNLISFVTPKGEFIKALEIKTDEAIYLFKIDKNMEVPDDENQENETMAMSEFENFKGIDCIENSLKSSTEVNSVKRKEYYPLNSESQSKPIAFTFTYSLRGAPEPDEEIFLNRAPSGKWQLKNSFGRINIPMDPAKKEYAFKVIDELNNGMTAKCNITFSTNLKKTGS